MIIILSKADQTLIQNKVDQTPTLAEYVNAAHWDQLDDGQKIAIKFFVNTVSDHVYDSRYYNLPADQRWYRTIQFNEAIAIGQLKQFVQVDHLPNEQTLMNLIEQIDEYVRHFDLDHMPNYGLNDIPFKRLRDRFEEIAVSDLTKMLNK